MVDICNIAQAMIQARARIIPLFVLKAKDYLDTVLAWKELANDVEQIHSIHLMTTLLVKMSSRNVMDH